jgi:phosphotriesterase-related protein
VTPDHLGGDVDQLARLSRMSGVDVIRGCGAYIERSWPEAFHSFDEQQFAEHILNQFETARPPAVIGEIGTSAPMTAAERRSLAGAALAQAELDVPLYVHLHPWEPDAHAAIDLVEAHGGDLARTVLCHMDVTAPSAIDMIEDLLRRGCFVAFDIWGDEDIYGDVEMPADVDRARATADLVSRGWSARLLHSHDICTKSQLRKFGGPGFAHLPAKVPSLFRQAGLTDDDIERQLATNALSLLGLGEDHPVEAGGIGR